MAYSPADLAILGLKITHGGKDLGVVSDFGFTPNTTTYEFKSTRNGKEETVRSVVISVDLTITFASSNVLDSDVVGLFTGSGGSSMTFEATEGALIVTRPNAETGGRSVVFNIPNASVRGTGMTGTPGTEEAKYTFEAKALSTDQAALGTLSVGGGAA
jgi:hypothetical protein